MSLVYAKEKIGIRVPFFTRELTSLLNIKNRNTLNQTISNLTKFGLIKRVENGLYYFPDTNARFRDLAPSLESVVNKKYLKNYAGIRTGAFLAYKYKLTSQVSGYYEIVTNNVNKNVRGKKEFDGKVIVWASKFQINKRNYLYAEFLELINNARYSDYNSEITKDIIMDAFKLLELEKEKVKKFLKHYRGSYYFRFRKLVEEILNEIA